MRSLHGISMSPRLQRGFKMWGLSRLTNTISVQPRPDPHPHPHPKKQSTPPRPLPVDHGTSLLGLSVVVGSARFLQLGADAVLIQFPRVTNHELLGKVLRKRQQTPNWNRCSGPRGQGDGRCEFQRGREPCSPAVAMVTGFFKTLACDRKQKTVRTTALMESRCFYCCCRSNYLSILDSITLRHLKYAQCICMYMCVYMCVFVWVCMCVYVC